MMGFLSVCPMMDILNHYPLVDVSDNLSLAVQQPVSSCIETAQIRHVITIRRAGSPCVHGRALLEQKSGDLQRLLDELRGILRGWSEDNGVCIGGLP
jgi:hypothetical protein